MVSKSKKESADGRKWIQEFLIVVLGVLVALWVNAAWQSYQNRQTEKLILANLQADFSSNLERIDRLVHGRSDMFRLSIDALENGIEHVPDDSLFNYYLAFFSGETFNPKVGALNAALSSGTFMLIRNPDLRIELAAWSGLFEDAEEELIVGFNSVREITPSMPESFFVPIVTMIKASSPAAVSPDSLRSMLNWSINNHQVRNALYSKAISAASAQGELEALRVTTKNIVDFTK
jgi:hypothetical protein